jgi:hypothetical protein
MSDGTPELVAKPLAVQKIEDGRFELVASRCITKD